MEDCYVQFLMNQRSQIPFYVPPHNHNCYELVYYIDGTGKTVIDGVEYQYTPGTFAMIAPKAVHDEIAFTDTRLIYIGYLYNANKYTFETKLYTDHTDAAIGSAVARMAEEWEKKPPFYSYKMNNIMQEILIDFFRRHHAAKDDENSRVVQYAKQYIDEHALEPTNLKDIAGMTGYSYDWIRHLFKEYTGQSLSQYIMLKKLQHAALLLRTTKKSIEEISVDCNFSSASRFIGYFKRAWGMTPAQFRKTVNEKGTVQWSFDV